ncbi:MAG TPA: hypothetical protein VKB42_05560 [Dongiaceae bacterium]|nr:hypothetical protein [Dongiaceae bacterium]
MRKCHGQQRHRGNRREDQAGSERIARQDAPGAEPAVEKSASHDAQRGCREDEAILRGSQAHDVDQVQRRTADIGEERPEGGGVDEDVAKADGIQQDAKIVAGEDGGNQPVGRVDPCALGESQHHCQHQEEADTGKHRMDEAPAPEGEERCSGRRCHHGDDHHGDGHVRELRTCGLALEQVADYGQGDGHARAGARTLDDAPDQQDRQGSGQRAADPGHDEEQACEGDDRLSAISIGGRPIDKRRDGETDHEQAHHQAGLGRPHAEGGARRREGRQAHIDAEGRQRHEKAQQ